MLHYIVFMPLLAPMFAGLVASSISMLSGENFQSLCVSEKGVVNFGLVWISRVIDSNVLCTHGANLLSQFLASHTSLSLSLSVSSIQRSMTVEE